MGKEVFVTGASGFVGKELVHRFLEEDGGNHYHLLVRSDTSERNLKRNFIDYLDRIDFVRGDITEPYLGISLKDRKRLGKKAQEVWHMAASTDFDESKRESIERTNILGTQNMLALASEFEKLDRFFYMSTAYVCGKEKGEIPEGDYVNTVGYKNPYEESKHHCEQIVRNSWDLPYTIVRPSIIMGDSKTKDAKGENRMYYGYLLTLYASILNSFNGKDDFREYWENCDGELDFRRVSFRLPGSDSTTKNIVTLDDVVGVCEAIRKEDGGEKKTYNVVNPLNRTMRDTTNSIERALKVKGIDFEPNLSKDNLDKKNKSEKRAFNFTKVYHPYFKFGEPDWRTDNTDALDVDRVEMTENLFFEMMDAYVKKEIIGG